MDGTALEKYSDAVDRCTMNLFRVGIALHCMEFLKGAGLNGMHGLWRFPLIELSDFV